MHRTFPRNFSVILIIASQASQSSPTHHYLTHWPVYIILYVGYKDSRRHTKQLDLSCQWTVSSPCLSLPRVPLHYFYLVIGIQIYPRFRIVFHNRQPHSFSFVTLCTHLSNARLSLAALFFPATRSIIHFFPSTSIIIILFSDTCILS